MEVILVICVLYLVFFGIFILIKSNTKTAKENKEAQEKQRIENEKIRLEQQKQERIKQRYALLKKYQSDCDANEQTIGKLNPEAKRQKLYLIGQKHFGNDFDLDKINVEIKEMNATLKREEEQKHIEELRKEETAKYEEIIEFSKYRGVEKRLHYLYTERISTQIECDDLIAKIDLAKKCMSGVADLQKSDWAINGGIASAIGGSAIGYITAQNTMNKNAAIDRYNAETREIGQQLYQTCITKWSDCKSKLDKFDRIIEETKQKLVSNIVSSEVFKSLKVSNIELTPSLTGAVYISIAIGLGEKIDVFGTVPTVIDGSLKIKLYQNDSFIGETVSILPKMGIDKKTKIESVYLNSITNIESIDVKIEPNNLWFMEK